MAKRKPKPKPETDPVPSGLDALAQYNAERARGLVHTPEWDEHMAKLQARFDADVAEEARWEAGAYTVRRRRRVNLN